MKNLTLVGNYDGWQVYENRDGFLEGYKKVGKNKYSADSDEGADVKRVVTNQTTMAGFEKYVRGLKTKTTIKDKKLPAGKLPNIPFPD